MRPSDIVARHGGDEFTILCEDLPDVAEARAIAQRIGDATLHAGAGARTCRLSVGYSVADDPDSDPTTLVGLADKAMYDQRRKQNGAAHRPRLVQAAAGEATPSDPGGEPGIDGLAVAAHELRTPLTAMVGFAATLRERWTRMTPSDIDSALSALDRHARRNAGIRRPVDEPPLPPVIA